jgi:hypothetical protein
MIRSVGIDLSRTGSYRFHCLDEQAMPCDGFSIDSSLEGLEKLEERIFSNGACPTIVFKPTGLDWIPLAVYLRARHPECRLVNARLQKVAALRKYLRSRTKSDRVDGVILAKMPFIDSEQLDGAYLPPAKYHALQRLTRQRERLMKGITTRKNRIGSIVNGYLPGLRKAFANEWSERAREFYRKCLNPYQVSRNGKRALEELFVRAEDDGGLIRWGNTLRRWREPIMNYFDNGTTNGFTQGCNTNIKMLKRVSYGLWNIDVYWRKMLL